MGEVTGITVEDVNLKLGIVRVVGKGRRESSTVHHPMKHCRWLFNDQEEEAAEHAHHERPHPRKDDFPESLTT